MHPGLPLLTWPEAPDANYGHVARADLGFRILIEQEPATGAFHAVEYSA